MNSPSQQVGDVHSTARGSGARYNANKPPMELIPLYLIGEYLAHDGRPESLALIHLGEFQRGGGKECLYQAVEAIGAEWHECAHVFDYGRAKYAEWNWAKGMVWSIPLACAARHLLRLAAGEIDDQESNLPHRGHVLCNIVMLLTFVDSYPEGDDRPVQWLGEREKEQA